MIPIELLNANALLLPEKAIWLPAQRSLVVADIHWGKIDHFRKAGIPIPTKGNYKNMETLVMLINTHQPERLILLGDLFHSDYNQEWETFGQVRKAFMQCSFELVMGNHDILGNHQYQRHLLKVHQECLRLGNLLFTHEPIDVIPEGQFNLAGHIHPGAHLVGKGRQSLMLPCFHVKKNQCVLPAFGTFTGLAKVKPKPGEKVFVIAEGKVLDVNNH